MNGRLVCFGFVGLLAAYGCAGEHFDEECPAGTVMLGTQCVVPAPTAGAAGAAAGSAGTSGAAGASGTGGLAGKAGAAGAGAGGAAGTSGSSTGGAAGSGGKAGGGGTSGTGGMAGAGGTAGSAGLGGTGLGGSAGGGAGGGGMTGKGGGAGAAGVAGAGGAGAAGAGGAAAGTGGGGSAGTAGTSGAGNGGAGTGGAGGAGSGGTAGAGGGCDVSACTADECYVPTCDGGNCGQTPADAGLTCGTTGVCNGKGVCGDCKPGNQDCSGKTPRTCGDDGKWVDGTACDIECTGAGVCSTVVRIAQGPSDMCAQLSSGTVRCWGSFPTTTNSSPIDGLDGVVHLAAALGTRCAVKGDGSVWCWGSNGSGAMGQDIAVTDSAVPLQVPNVANAKEVFGGYGGAFCARQTGNTMTCWGDTIGVPTPTTVPNPTQAAFGDAFGCIRTSLGEVWCWGRDSEGECGTGTTGGADVTTPKKITTLSGVLSLSAGRQHVCAQTNINPALYCWGGDTLGAVGNGSPGTNTGTPVDVLSGISPAFSTGGYHVCAVQGAEVMCWGQLGAVNYAPTKYVNVPVPSQITGGGASACGVFGPTDVRCWKKDEAPSPVMW